MSADLVISQTMLFYNQSVYIRLAHRLYTDFSLNPVTHDHNFSTARSLFLTADLPLKARSSHSDIFALTCKPFLYELLQQRTMENVTWKNAKRNNEVAWQTNTVAVNKHHNSVHSEAAPYLHIWGYICNPIWATMFSFETHICLW